MSPLVSKPEIEKGLVMPVIGFSSPDLVKFCPAQYNIRKGCNTVRIGTLFDFRTIDNEKLRDVDEGRFSYQIKFPSLTKVSKAWISAFEIECEGDFQCDSLVVENGQVFTTGMTIDSSSHNCWVYCISKSSHSAGEISVTHEDQWAISADKVGEFATYLANLLWSEVKIGDIPDDIVSRYSLQDIKNRLNLYMDIKEISYVDRIRTINSEAEFSVKDIESLKANLAFMKPKFFEPENEVRFAFWLTFDGKKISIKNNPKFLSLRPVDQFF
ncbi:hypothetical protein ACI2KS_10860 [Pseudomonas sp. NPDC087358]|uniref:hypothetical protein n=1 Tax=Pseudomonas sp. NPDC087358 TaxID=3364439 RepID=UPI00384FFE39